MRRRVATQPFAHHHIHHSMQHCMNVSSKRRIVVGLHGDDVSHAFPSTSNEHKLSTLSGFRDALHSKLVEASTAADTVIVHRPDVQAPGWQIGNCAASLLSLVQQQQQQGQDDASLTLVAFSRGSVALSRLLIELVDCSTKGACSIVHMYTIKGVHIIDGGTSSADDEYAYVPYKYATRLHTCLSPQAVVTLEGTPRQWADPARPWLARAKDAMLKGLHEAANCSSITVSSRVHFEDEAPSLSTHVRCIECVDVSSG